MDGLGFKGEDDSEDEVMGGEGADPSVDPIIVDRAEIVVVPELPVERPTEVINEIVASASVMSGAETIVVSI